MKKRFLLKIILSIIIFHLLSNTKAQAHDYILEQHEYTITYGQTILWSPTTYHVDEWFSGNFLYMEAVFNVRVITIESVPMPKFEFIFDSCGTYKIIADAIVIGDTDTVFCIIYELTIHVLPIVNTQYNVYCKGDYIDDLDFIITGDTIIYIEQHCSVYQYELTVKECGDFYVPTAISPNNDGINDVFKIYTANPDKYFPLEVRIFDRWGCLVYLNAEFDENSYWDAEGYASDVYVVVVIYKGYIKKQDLTILK